jgi:DNA-binding Lrp family transcriptional regulator
MVDKIDMMILHNICKDANISNAKLAKTIGVNVVTVAKRINKMINDGLITIKAVPNSIRLGYKIKAIIVLTVDWNCINNIIARLKESPNILLMVTTIGRFDILMIADFPEWDKLNTFIKEEVAQCPGVKHIDVLFVTELKKMYRDIFRYGEETGPSITPDNIDSQLIGELCKNGRTGYTDIARKLGVSQATVSRRVSVLLQNNLIKIMAIPNPSKFGPSANAFILLETEHTKADDICTQLSAYPQVYGSMTLSFGFDILLYVQFKTTELLHEFIKEKFSQIGCIATIEILVVAEYLKTTYESVDFEYKS